MFLGIRDVSELEKKVYRNTIHTFEIVDMIETIKELRKRNEQLTNKLKTTENHLEAYETSIDLVLKDIRKVA